VPGMVWGLWMQVTPFQRPWGLIVFSESLSDLGMHCQLYFKLKGCWKTHHDQEVPWNVFLMRPIKLFHDIWC
jgi:hypothetical protein